MQYMYTFYSSKRAYEIFHVADMVDRKSSMLYRVESVDTPMAWMALTYVLRKNKLLKFPWEEDYFNKGKEQ